MTEEEAARKSTEVVHQIITLLAQDESSAEGVAMGMTALQLACAMVLSTWGVPLNVFAERVRETMRVRPWVPR